MDHFQYKGSELYAEDVSIKAAAAAIGTPFYCYSTATLTRHYTVLKDALAGLNTRICYAVKANSNLAILKTLATLGSGADVVSQGEILFAREAGIDAKRIVFSGVGKTAEEMLLALNEGIFQFNVESEPELRLLSEVACARVGKAAIALRVNPDVKPDTHSKIATGGKESKFGVPLDQARALYQLAKTLPGIEVQGVSMHIGSQLTSLAPFGHAFDRLADFTKQLRADGHKISTVDIGGGLGIPYGQQDPPPLPSAYAALVKEKIGLLNAEIILEPGRLLVGNAGILVSRVIYVKRGADRLFVILDAGMNDLLRPTLYEAYHDIVHVDVRADAPTELVDVVGPVCESGDIFAEQRLMKVPQPGDLLAFRTAGAYGAVMASTYNARRPIAEAMVNGERIAVVRRRPTYEDMLAAEAIPDWFDDQ